VQTQPSLGYPARTVPSATRFPEVDVNPSTNPPSPSLAGRKLVQVALTTRDPERSKRFYHDVLGLPLIFEVPNMTFYQLGELRLMVGVEPTMTPGGSVLYVDAPDIETLGDELEQRGVSFGGAAVVVQRTEKGELKLREFKDPDGNALALMGFVPK
jgi:catechol 2,3-dioxygenase-like lactoylglutathione lyase family enzyme